MSYSWSNDPTKSAIHSTASRQASERGKQPINVFRCSVHATARPHQRRQRHLRRLPPTQDRLHDIRRQQGQSQNTAHVGLIYFLGAGDLRDGRVRTVLQLLPPAECSSDRIGSDQELPAAAPP